MPESTFCDGVGSNHNHWEISTRFSCTLRSETEQPALHFRILEAELRPWAHKHFDDAPWTLQQDSAPSHGSKMTQSWIQDHIPVFISKDGSLLEPGFEPS